MIHFGSPAYLALAFVVVLMALGVYLIARWRRTAGAAFAGPRARRWRATAFWARSLLLLIAASLLVVAAARPQWGARQRSRDIQGIDLVIALDISQSMTATDVSPSRLKVAQDNLVTLVNAQRGSRIGLVFFAGSAILRSPLSSDTQAIEQLIMRADREFGLTRVGSDLGGSLQQAATVLSGSQDAGRAVLLVSDGEDFGNTYADQAASLRNQGIAIFTAGVGTPEGTGLADVNPRDGKTTPKLGSNGQPVVTRLNESTLQSIAETGGGTYTRLTSDPTRLLAIRNDLARLDQTSLGTETQQLPIERFQLFAGAAVVLLLLSWFIPDRLPSTWVARLARRRPHPGLALLVLALIGGACGSSDPLRGRNQEANRLYDAGNYQGALDIYQQLLAQRPDVDQLSYNAGNALDRLKQYDRAVTETQRALPPTDSVLGARTYYGLGNHLLAAGRLEEAYVAYRNALLLDSSDADAKHNLELALNLISQRDNQQPPGTNGGSGDQGNGPPGAGATPGASETPQPAEGSPPTGQGSTEPGASGTPAVGGTPGRAPGEPSQDPAALQRALSDALAGIGDEPTYEQAIHILDLLQQQQGQQIAPGGPSSGPGY